MQFKHLSLESERQTRLLVAAVCASLGASCHGSLMASSSRAATLHLQHVCANSFCPPSPLSSPSLAATVNDHELRQRRSLCRSCSHDFMHYAQLTKAADVAAFNYSPPPFFLLTPSSLSSSHSPRFLPFLLLRTALNQMRVSLSQIC